MGKPTKGHKPRHPERKERESFKEMYARQLAQKGQRPRGASVNSPAGK